MPSNPRYPGDLELVEKYKVPVVLTSKGAPGDAIKRIHGWGAVALHDIANRRHAEKALEAGVDGVIAVAGGAGGHTGTLNPFALMNEVRQLGDHFAIVLAGGLTTGRDVLAAETMGADLAYIGTRFIATREAMAADAHKKMILDTRATDVFLTASIDGAPANWLTPSLLAAGIDLDVLRTTLPGKIVAAQENKKRWKDIYTAGHGVGNIDDIPAAAELCRRLVAQYREARARWRRQRREQTMPSQRSGRTADIQADRCSPVVVLSAAKDLTPVQRAPIEVAPDPSLRSGDKDGCCGRGSATSGLKILRCAQDDRFFSLRALTDVAPAAALL